MSHDHCEHVWIANGGKGGKPDFRPNRVMWFGVKMYVICAHCGCRTWLSPERWDALPVEGERLTRQHRRRLERMGITESKRLVPASEEGAGE